MTMPAWIRSFVYACISIIASTAVLLGQGIQDLARAGSAQIESRDYSIKVAVDEVRLDAVVLDWKGRQITDLTADDFEIYQDGKRQKIVSSNYINEERVARKESKDSTGAPLTSNPMLDKERVKQTIIFIVDDLSMEIRDSLPNEQAANGLKMTTGYNSLHNARTAVRKFVDTQMQPGDLIAILKTGMGTSATQMFSSDRQQLLSIIDNMRWGGTKFLEGTSERQTGVKRRLVRASEGKIGVIGVDPFWERVAYETNSSPQNQLLGKIREVTVLDLQLSIIQYCVRAIRDMSGRKSIFFLSPITTVDKSWNKGWMARLNALADEALRSGVVIHTLDLSLEDSPIFRTDLPLSKMTGGSFIRGPSFWQSKDGIGSANELLKGYYLLSYIPPDNTFSKDNKTSNPKSYHQIKIKVKRGSVYNRDGFFGLVDKERYEEPSFPARDKTLQDVLYSPFQNTDINVNLSSSYAYFEPIGYFLRAWLHVDAKSLTFKKEKNGESSVSIEVAAVIADSRSMERYAKGIKCDIFIPDGDIPFAKEQGFDFSIYLSFRDHAPLWETHLIIRSAIGEGSFVPDYMGKKMGSGYYVRASVRDLASGKAGSAYQFMEIPNIKEPQLALSSFFLFNRKEDLDKFLTGDDSELQTQLEYDPQTAGKSPALRSYLPGESFDYALMVYNANPQKQEDSQLEAQIVLLKDGQECFRSEIEDVPVPPANGSDMVPIVKKLTLSEDMAPGDYVMQFMIRDKKPDKNRRAAAQAIDFTVQDRPTEPATEDEEDSKE
jgi:VWFA-related protein